jgi:hypothetical protein
LKNAQSDFEAAVSKYQSECNWGDELAPPPSGLKGKK